MIDIGPMTKGFSIMWTRLVWVATFTLGFASLVFPDTAKALTGRSAYCVERDRYKPLSGDWQWEILDSVETVSGTFHPCSIEILVRAEANRLCLHRQAHLNVGKIVFLTPPAGSTSRQLLLLCEHWAQTFSLRVRFRGEITDGKFQRIEY